MIKQSLKLLVLATIALLAGLAGGQIAFSYLMGDYSRIFGNNNGNISGPMPAAQKEVTIRENEAIVEAIARAAGVSVNVEVALASGATARGSGIIITSDGMAAVPYSLYPPGAQAKITSGGQKVSYTVLKRDKAADITILKLEGNNWPTAGFASLDSLALGQRMFIAGTLSSDSKFANEGIIRFLGTDYIGTSIIENKQASGSPVFDIEGNIIGMALVDESNFVNAISVAKIKELSGL